MKAACLNFYFCIIVNNAERALKVFPSYYSFRFVYFNQSYMLFILFFIFFLSTSKGQQSWRENRNHAYVVKNLQKKNYFLKLGFGAEA